jgi:cytochrome P450
METRINVEVTEFVRQAKLRDGQPFDPNSLMHTCVLNVILSILVGRRYTYGHPNLVHMNECIRNVLNGIVQELELFPTLQYVPPFRSRLQRYKNLMELFRRAAEKEVIKFSV